VSLSRRVVFFPVALLVACTSSGGISCSVVKSNYRYNAQFCDDETFPSCGIKLSAYCIDMELVSGSLDDQRARVVSANVGLPFLYALNTRSILSSLGAGDPS
jgi:hypothetical protein